jgi:hypothetical protein
MKRTIHAIAEQVKRAGTFQEVAYKGWGLSGLLTLAGAWLQCLRKRPKVTILENKVALSAFVVFHGRAQIKFVLHDQ